MTTEEHVASLQLYVAGEFVRPRYQPGASEKEVERAFGVSGAVKLSSNENPLGPSPRAVLAAREGAARLHRYPEDAAEGLRHALARHHEVATEGVVLGNGSGELVSLLVRVFCTSATDEVLVADPSFALYAGEAEAHGARVVRVPLDSGFRFDVDGLLRAAGEHTRVCFVCTPNNPTGTHLPAEELDRLVRGLPEHVVLVVDEAYADFVPVEERPDGAAALEARSRMAVIRTFSKAHGLAGLRIGYMLATPGVAAGVQRLRLPFNVSSLAQGAALAALADLDHLVETRETVAAGREYLRRELEALGVQCWPSVGSFLLVDLGCPADPVFRALCRQGVIVRRLGDPQHLRISVGTREQNERLVAALRSALREAAVGPHSMHPLFAAVLEAGSAASRGDVDRARELLDRLQVEASPEGTAVERVSAVFARALRARVLGEDLDAGNLYDARPGAGDMLAAFHVLVRSTPLVTFGHENATTAIAAAVEGEDAVHILDLGMGGGTQWPLLFRALAARPGGAPRVRLTGVDLPAPEGEPDARLREAMDRLAGAAAEAGVPFEGRVVATQLERMDYGALELREGEALVVNAALALHHVPDGYVDPTAHRDRVLRAVCGLNPRLVTLVEPDLEHNALGFLPRLRESLGHYATVFAALDTLLPRDLPERATIEREFFGREVLNVLAASGTERVERHERRQSWRRRMLRAGFEPAEGAFDTAATAGHTPIPANFDIREEPGMRVLHWSGLPLMAVSAWRPRA